MSRLDPKTRALLRPASGGGAAGPMTAPALFASLAQRGVHEFAEARFGDLTAAAGLALAVLGAARPGPVLWVTEARLQREHGRLSARGVQAMGADPGRLLSVAAGKTLDVLWCVEEGLRSGAVAAVVAAVSEASFTATRRLSLAAAEAELPALLLMPHNRGGASAAQSRWRVASAPSAPNRYDPEAPGAPRWQVTLERARLAPEAVGRRFDLELEDETHHLRVVDRLADRSLEAPGRAAGAAAGNLARTG